MKPLLAFDLDGTLIDSAQDIADAVNLTLTRHGKKKVAFETVVAHIGEGLRKLIMDFFPELKADQHASFQLEQEFLVDYENQMFNKTQVYPGVFDFLKTWEGPISIITNKNEAPAKALVHHLGLHQFSWIEILGADSLPEKKPSPLPLQTVMSLAQRSPQTTIMIGDGTPDLLSAQRAGTHSIAIGFGYTSSEILQTYQPSAFLSSYSNLDKLIKGLGFLN